MVFGVFCFCRIAADRHARLCRIMISTSERILGKIVAHLLDVLYCQKRGALMRAVFTVGIGVVLAAGCGEAQPSKQEGSSTMDDFARHFADRTSGDSILDSSDLDETAFG